MDHANALLADAGCDDVTVLDAGDAPRRLAVALVTDEQACTFARLASTGRDRACRPRRDDQPLQVRSTHPGPQPSASTSGLLLAHGLAPAAADTVEVRAGVEEVSAEAVPVADGVSAFTALLEGEGAVGATARDAAGEVLAEADAGPPDGRIEPRPDPVPGEAPEGPDGTAAPPTRGLSPSS